MCFLQQIVGVEQPHHQLDQRKAEEITPTPAQNFELQIEPKWMSNKTLSRLSTLQSAKAQINNLDLQIVSTESLQTKQPNVSGKDLLLFVLSFSLVCFFLLSFYKFA